MAQGRLRLLMLIPIDDIKQLPFLEQGCDGVASAPILVGEVRLLAIEQEQLLEVDDVVPTTLVEDMAGLIELLLFLRSDADASKGLLDLKEILLFSYPHLQKRIQYSHESPRKNQKF